MSWIDQYRSKLMTAREAVACVESGMRVYIHPGCAEPEALVEALMGRAPFVKDVEVVHLLTLGTSPYCAPEMAEHFRHNALFVGGNVREAVNDGRADYTPIFLGEVEALFESGEMPIDVAFIQVSPPDSAWLLQLRRRSGMHADGGEICPSGGGAGERADAAHLRRQLHSRQRTRRHRRTLAPAVRVEGATQYGVVSGHRRASGIADRRWSGPTMWDRRHSRRCPAQPDGPQRPGGPHRADLRQRDSPDRGGSHQRSAQELEAAQDHSRLCAGHQEAVRFRRRKPYLRVSSFGLHQRSLPHRAERSHGGHQLGHRSGS